MNDHSGSKPENLKSASITTTDESNLFDLSRTSETYEEMLITDATRNVADDSIGGIIILIKRFKIRRLVCLNCEFEDNIVKEMLRDSVLEVVTFINCLKEIAFVRSCLSNTKTLKAISIDKDEAMWRRTDISTLPCDLNFIAGDLKDNYCFVSLEIKYFNDYMKSISNPRFAALQAKASTSVYKLSTVLQRNVDGYRRCRDVIYTLFLIKNRGIPYLGSWIRIF